MLRFDTFDAAYRHGLRWVYEAPQHFSTPRGFASRENLGFCFELTNPLARIPYSAARKTNIVFNFAEALWYLSGQADLDRIGHYAPSIRKYSMDGSTLTGTAYGTKIFHFGGAAINQWKQVAQLLREDPSTKRAVLQIFDAHELLVADNIDVSCTLGLQFFARKGRLHAAAFMRANDAYRGIVSDVFSFTFLQEMMAHQLGLQLGSYYHYVGSFHIYEPDIAAVERFLAEPPSSEASAHLLPAMPEGDNWEAVRVVLQHEQELRHNRRQITVEGLASTGVPIYWQQVLGLFEVHRQIHYEGRINQGLVDCLPAIYQWLIASRWNNLFLARQN
ncbi:thymidylate synthase [Corallococcus exiguus]|uniref:thymidylate synthase n=1 Tax=Corallococcus exiguus TaxID=83462 RepID=UPI00147144E9|nr:thymidylate synthase [Corallococcus exiguus]NNB94890.1 thymidylate synthase [Corallococcus exiguus]NNC02615.1 thymidylate synthase [Corallococcus exiguus]